MLFARIIQNVNYVLKAFLISLKITDVFVLTNIINFSSFALMSYYQIAFKKLGYKGYIIAQYAKVISEFLFLLYFCLM